MKRTEGRGCFQVGLLSCGMVSFTGFRVALRHLALSIGPSGAIPKFSAFPEVLAQYLICQAASATGLPRRLLSCSFRGERESITEEIICVSSMS